MTVNDRIITRPINGDPFNKPRRGHRGLLLMQLRKLRKVKDQTNDVIKRIDLIKSALESMPDLPCDGWRPMRFVRRRKPWQGKIYNDI